MWNPNCGLSRHREHMCAGSDRQKSMTTPRGTKDEWGASERKDPWERVPRQAPGPVCCLPACLPNCRLLVSADTLSAPPRWGPVGSRQCSGGGGTQSRRAEWDGLGWAVMEPGFQTQTIAGPEAGAWNLKPRPGILRGLSGSGASCQSIGAHNQATTRRRERDGKHLRPRRRQRTGHIDRLHVSVEHLHLLDFFCFCLFVSPKTWTFTQTPCCCSQAKAAAHRQTRRDEAGGGG